MHKFLVAACLCAIMAGVMPAVARVLITEICTDPQTDWSGGNWLADGGGSVTGSDEYVELFNAGADTADLRDWMIECTDSQRDTHLIDSALIARGASGTRVAPGAYAVLGNIRGDMNNSVQVSLYDTAGALVDRVALGTFVDADSSDNAPDGNSDTTGTAVGRDRFHTDTGTDSIDFLTVFASPGSMNAYATPGRISTDTTAYTGFGAVLTVYFRDRDRDVSAGADRCTVVVRSRRAGDAIAVVLAETDVRSAAFGATVGFAPFTGSSGSVGVDPDGDTVDVVSVDPAWGDTASASVTWLPPVDSGRVVVNEVMANAYGSEPDNEWIELYNADTDTVRLRGWTLAVGASSVPLPDTLVLAPGAYCVVARQVIDTDGDEESFERLWGDGDDAWGSGAAETYPAVPLGFANLTNDGNTVTLANGAGYADSVAWTSDAGNGVSWERVVTDDNAVRTCADAAGGTPGGRNSVTPYPHDCMPVPGSVTFTLIDSATSELAVRVTNCGLDDAAATVAFTSGTVAVGTGPTGTLAPGDTAAVTVVWDTTVSTAYTVLITVSADDFPGNDTLAATVELEGMVVSDVIVNELMFDPGEDGKEWIELYNRGGVPVSLYGWSCGDADGGTPFDSAVIAARGFVVVADDRETFLERYPWTACPVVEPGSWKTLSNGGDDAVVRDRFGRTVDAVSYRAAWMGDAEGVDGVSLERIDPDAAADADNWWACVAAAGATPGAVNSISVSADAGRTRIRAVPDPFSPDGDGYDDETVIEIRVPERAYVTAELYDVRGRLLKTFCEDAPCTGSYGIRWDGDGDDGKRVDLGIYVLYLEARDADDGRIRRHKATVVSARRMN